jgi:Phosphorylase superfamily
MTSAGQILPVRAPPYFILIDRALRDEGTSYHYLPPGDFSRCDPVIVEVAHKALAETSFPFEVGATWTTDAPFRETATAVAKARGTGLLAVEMEAAALYAFAAARRRPVLCVAHVTNQMGQIAGDFEKGRRHRSRRVAWRRRFDRAQVAQRGVAMKRPVFIARQSAKPSGLLGQVIAGIMSHETSDLNEHAVRLLRPSPFDRVLEVGFGHGRTIERLASVVQYGRVCGIDVSDSIDVVGFERRSVVHRSWEPARFNIRRRHPAPPLQHEVRSDEELFERKTIVALAASVSARPLVRHPAADEMNIRRQPVVAADLSQLWALVSESDGSTRLSFPSTAPGREVFQSNVAAGICDGRDPLPARRLRDPCVLPAADRHARLLRVHPVASPRISRQYSVVHDNTHRPYEHTS